MLELAITHGADFVRYSRNAKAIELPDGTIVLGPLDLDALPHVAGDYVIRLVRLIGPEPGALEIGGTAPPLVDGDVVVVRRTVQALPDEMVAALEAQAQQARRAEIAAELAAIDAASARPLRAIVGGTATQADRDRLADLESSATALRAELATIPTIPTTP